jgi:hydroxymethylbilane synthase
MIAKVTLGTRGSELARAQTLLVEKAIRSVHPSIEVETKIILTRGDNAKFRDPRAGRKGLFTAEIERALLAGEVDVAVHSAKDLPSETSPGAEIMAVLPRAAVNDVLISKHSGGLAGLPAGATVATGSVRRERQLHWKRADLSVIDLRGNVPTRLRKLVENQWDGIVLAAAGLERLGVSPTRSEIGFEGRQFFLEILAGERFLPAGGQGIIAVQSRIDDESAKALLDPVNDRETLLCLQAEREFLRRLHGDCNVPVGVLATISNGNMKMRAQLFEGESLEPREGEVEGGREEGAMLARELLRKIEQEHE